MQSDVAENPQRSLIDVLMKAGARRESEQGKSRSGRNALAAALLARQGAPSRQSEWQPFARGAPQQEVAQAMAPVSGQNVRPISFGGASGDVPPEETIARRQRLADALLASSQGQRNIQHPTQGLAQIAQAAAGAYGGYRADQQARELRDTRAQALLSLQNGGSVDQLMQVDPDLGFEVMQQREAAAAAQQQAAMQRQQELDDARREREWDREDYLYKKGVDQQYAEPKLTDDQREYKQAVEQGFDGTLQDFILAGKRAGSNQVTIDQRGEGAYSKTAGEGLAKQNLEEAAKGRDAAATLDRVSTMRATLAGMDDQGAVAGFQRFLGERGIHLGDASEQELMVSLREAMIPSLHTTAGPMTDSDAKMYRSVLPRLVNTKEGNALILDMMEGASRYDAEVGRIAQQRLTGKISDDEYYDQVSALGSPQKMFMSRLRDFRESSPEFQRAVQMLDANRQLVNDSEYKAALDAIREGADPQAVIGRIRSRR